MCAADDTKDPEKMCDEDLLKQVGHLPFCCLSSTLSPVDWPAVSLWFVLTSCLCCRCPRWEHRFAWIGTAKAWTMYVSSRLRHPWGRHLPLTPLIVIPSGSQMPQQTQSWLLMKVFSLYRIVKPNLPSMAAGLLTASPWTCWVMNSFWNSYFRPFSSHL